MKGGNSRYGGSGNGSLECPQPPHTNFPCLRA